VHTLVACIAAQPLQDLIYYFDGTYTIQDKTERSKEITDSSIARISCAKAGGPGLSALIRCSLRTDPETRLVCNIENPEKKYLNRESAIYWVCRQYDTACELKMLRFLILKNIVMRELKQLSAAKRKEITPILFLGRFDWQSHAYHLVMGDTVDAPGTAPCHI